MLVIGNDNKNVLASNNINLNALNNLLNHPLLLPILRPLLQKIRIRKPSPRLRSKNLRSLRTPKPILRELTLQVNSTAGVDLPNKNVSIAWIKIYVCIVVNLVIVLPTVNFLKMQAPLKAEPLLLLPPRLLRSQKAPDRRRKKNRRFTVYSTDGEL